MDCALKYSEHIEMEAQTTQRSLSIELKLAAKLFEHLR